MFIMMVWVNGMFAQTNVEFQELNDTTEVAPDNPEVEPQSQPATGNTDMEEIKALLQKFNESALAEQQLKKLDYSRIYKPLYGKRDRFYKFQQLEISILAGTDKKEDEDHQDEMDEAKKGNDINPGKSVNTGFNVSWSMGFIPGKIEGDSLHLNRFGFGYSLGVLAAMDSQEKYGTTFDLMAKIGVETGYGHAMGAGADLLFGTGKSAVTMEVPLTADYIYTEHDTEWCFKYGFQLWIRTSLLHANIKNTNVRFFVRYVYSKDPTDDADLDFNDDGFLSGYYIWNPESWQVGLTFCYEF